jgi:hypothetical protein
MPDAARVPGGTQVEGCSSQRVWLISGKMHHGWTSVMAELLGFPGVRHDDQVDSISQAPRVYQLAWFSMEQRRGIADLMTRVAQEMCHAKSAVESEHLALIDPCAWNPL